MKRVAAYPFYKSLRFRFGLVFGLLFLVFLVAIVVFVYNTVTDTLTGNFESRLQSGASLVLQKTEVSPLVIPLPQTHEAFRLVYHTAAKSTQLFSNLPAGESFPETDKHVEVNGWWYTSASRDREEGGTLTVLYGLPATEYQEANERFRRLLFLYVPAAFMLSLLAGYFFSGFLLSPISTIIDKAKKTDLQQDLQLLEETGTEDELHELTVALNRMLSRIRRQAEEQNAFFASASHELRTPLSIMLTELQVMQGKYGEAAFQAVFASQNAEIQQLSKLVNDFLLMSQLRSGNVVMNREPVMATELLIACMEQVRSKSYYASQRFRLTIIPPDGALNILCDKSHLHSMVRNLLENAVKYSVTGSLIHIRGSQEGETCILSFENESQVPVGDLSGLTAGFYRSGHYQEGFGLGLWIVDRLAALDKGSLELSYKPPHFTATLTLEKAGE